MINKFSPSNFSDVVMAYIEEEMNERASNLSSKNVSAYYDGNINITFDKPISKDVEQDRAGVVLSGGIILTAEGLRKKKAGEKLEEDDYYIINGIGKEL